MQDTLHRPPAGADGEFTVRSRGVSVSATAEHGARWRSGYSVDTFVVRPRGDAIVVGVFTGNDKYAPTIIASVLAADFIGASLNPADGPHALQSALLGANELIQELADGAREVPASILAELPPCRQGFAPLRGIGTSCAIAVVWPDTAWFAGVGECSVWRLDGADATELLVPELLSRDPIAGLPPEPWHAHVVRQALGVNRSIELRPTQRTALDGHLVLATASVARAIESAVSRRTIADFTRSRDPEAVRDALVQAVSVDDTHRACIVIHRESG